MNSFNPFDDLLFFYEIASKVFDFTLISYNVPVFTTSHRIKAPSKSCRTEDECPMRKYRVM
ncbi:hypothetical protein ACINKY_08095 [Paenibacillus illinoisensis]|uniref:Uncharacterized protein n=1 Tax=Paenibacillus illinoisensis TaxID=59845 RepID=A0ABW8HR87_9BACL